MFWIGSVHSTIADAVKANFLEKNHTSKDNVQGINVKGVSEILARGNTKRHAQCLKLNVIYSSGVQPKHVACHVLDTPDL